MKTSVSRIKIFITIIFIIGLLMNCGGNSPHSETPRHTLQKVGEYLLEGFSGNMSISNNTAIITHENQDSQGFYIDCDLYVIDISDPENPELIAVKKASDMFAGIAINDNKAYMAYSDYRPEIQWGGLLMEIDLTDPNLPILKSLLTDEIPNDFILNGDYGYLLDSKGVHVVDISSFTITATIGSLSSYIIKLDADRAYIAGGTNAIDIFDVSLPDSPILLGSFPNQFSASPHDIYIKEDKGALACGGYGVALFDVSNPENIELIKVIDTGGWAEGLTADEHYVFLADGDDGLVVIDPSDFINPKVIETIPVGGYARQVIVAGDYVYVLVNEKGLVIFIKSESL